MIVSAPTVSEKFAIDRSPGSARGDYNKAPGEVAARAVEDGTYNSSRPKKNRTPKGRSRLSLRRSLANLNLLNGGPVAGRDGGGLAGLEHRARGLEVRGS